MTTIKLGISKNDIWGLLDRHLYETFVKNPKYTMARQTLTDETATSVYTPLDGSLIILTLNWADLELTVEYYSDPTTLVDRKIYTLEIEPHWEPEDLANFVFYEVKEDNVEDDK